MKKIEVTPRDGAGYTLEKRGETWFLTAPIEARADQTQVQRMLDLLSAASKEKLAATDLKRFDLDPPALERHHRRPDVRLRHHQPAHPGAVRRHRRQRVSGVAYYASLVPRAADRLLTHSLFNQGEKPVGFTFKIFSVEQKDGKWTLRPAAAAEKERPEPGRSQPLGRRLALRLQPASRSRRAAKPAPETMQREAGGRQDAHLRRGAEENPS